MFRGSLAQLGGHVFTCKNEIENITHFLFLCPSCHENFQKNWSNLQARSQPQNLGGGGGGSISISHSHDSWPGTLHTQKMMTTVCLLDFGRVLFQ